ncbi:MAG: CBS domain-containing protein [Sulfolobus sp.]|nr:CBS domain-containing protein [Sulfolobus sp.]
MKKVKDYMSSPVLTVDENTSLQEVAKLLLERGFGSVLVAVNGEPKGIFTDRDALKALAMGLGPNDPVRLVATMGNLITVDEDVDVFTAAEIMTKNKIRHLPVKNKQGQIIGMFSITDLPKALVL